MALEKLKSAYNNLIKNEVLKEEKNQKLEETKKSSIDDNGIQKNKVTRESLRLKLNSKKELSAFDNTPNLYNTAVLINRARKDVSIDALVNATQDLIFGRGVTNDPIGDFLNPALSQIQYSTRATLGLPFKNLGDNPIRAVEKAVDEALKTNLNLPTGDNPATNFLIKEAQQALNSLKIKNIFELSEVAQVPVIGRPTPFMDLGNGPGETNYVDMISSQPVLSDESDDVIAPKNKGDFYVKIKDLRTGGQILYFRGFVTGITENVNPSFTPINYIGRSEPVYMYERAERDLSFTLRVHPANFIEQKLMYDKLEKLTGLAYPKYLGSDDLTRMQPPFTELYMAHIGTRKQGQFGFIKSISYTIAGESDWDALRVLPRLFDINISYQILSKKPPQMNDKFYGA